MNNWIAGMVGFVLGAIASPLVIYGCMVWMASVFAGQR